jgi:hypothetical protein
MAGYASHKLRRVTRRPTSKLIPRIRSRRLSMLLGGTQRQSSEQNHLAARETHVHSGTTRGPKIRLRTCLFRRAIRSAASRVQPAFLASRLSGWLPPPVVRRNLPSSQAHYIAEPGSRYDKRETCFRVGCLGRACLCTRRIIPRKAGG